ncbi:MAG: hypothetical protein HPZ91_04485 [Lentisphaeria bacterium]|nr:hypothetical protein [Lentisphaeria bacterium]
MKQFDIGCYDENMKEHELREDGFVWLGADDPRFRLDGFAFRRPGEKFLRVIPDPVLPEAVVNLGRHTSGGMLTFRTDSRRIRLRVKLSDHSQREHQALTGSGGFDLYAGPAGHRRFIGVTRYPFPANEYDALLLDRPEGEFNEFQLNWPLYSGVEEFRLGIGEGARLELPGPWPDPSPLVVYGSSITQGACASRPGCSYTAILSRALNRPVLNFGFSGNGKGEPAVIDMLARVEAPRLFVLDYQANAGLAGIRDTISGAVETLRRAHPAIPVLVVSQIRWNRELNRGGSDFLYPADEGEAVRIQRNEVERRRAAGDRLVFFFEGASLTGPDWHECTVDGVHPSDHGFFRMAAGLLPVINDILTLTGN